MKRINPGLILIIITASLIAFDNSIAASTKQGPIVKENNHISRVSKKDLKRMLLGKTKQWENGVQIVLATLSDGKTHEDFIKTFTGKTPRQFRNYWRKRVFSGRGKMPRLFTSEKALATFVANNKGALGYTSGEVLFNGTRVIQIE